MERALDALPLRRGGVDGLRAAHRQVLDLRRELPRAGAEQRPGQRATEQRDAVDDPWSDDQEHEPADRDPDAPRTRGTTSGSAQKYVTKKVPAKAAVQSTTVIVKVAMPQGMSASS